MLTIVGNGPSRLNYDLNELDHWWGCNAIYQDCIPDLLFVSDLAPQREVLLNNYYHDHKIAVGSWEIHGIEMLELMRTGFEYSHNDIRVDVDLEKHDRFIIQGNDSYVDFVGISSSHGNNIVMYNIPLLKNMFTGLCAVGHAITQGHKEVCLLGFDALQYDNPGNVYEGRYNYLPKYTKEERVYTAQRSQFIALLKKFPDIDFYWKNSLDENEKIEYNKLDYYESSDRWILGHGFENDFIELELEIPDEESLD